METRSSAIIWEVGRYGHALSLNIPAKIRWANDGTQTLEIPVTCRCVGADHSKLGTTVVLYTDEGTRFDVSVKPEELPRHIAAMIETSSSR